MGARPEFAPACYVRQAALATLGFCRTLVFCREYCSRRLAAGRGRVKPGRQQRYGFLPAARLFGAFSGDTLRQVVVLRNRTMRWGSRTMSAT